MASFSVFAPPDAQMAPEKIVFLRDGFSTPAFLLGPVWLLWKRAWLPAATVIALMSLLPLLAKLPGAAPALPVVLGLGLAFRRTTDPGVVVAATRLCRKRSRRRRK